MSTKTNVRLTPSGRAFVRVSDNPRLAGVDLSGQDLSGFALAGADLRGALLRGTDLRGARLAGALLRGADLRGASLANADLSEADLRGCDLRGADLRGANLDDAELDEADLRGTLREDDADVLEQFLDANGSSSVLAGDSSEDSIDIASIDVSVDSSHALQQDMLKDVTNMPKTIVRKTGSSAAARS